MNKDQNIDLIADKIESRADVIDNRYNKDINKEFDELEDIINKEIKNETKEDNNLDNIGSVEEIKDFITEIDTLQTNSTHELIIKRLQKLNVPYYSNSNISAYISDEEREQLISEAAEAYAKFMKCLCIDIENDPNAHDSPRRVSKQFINELMRGRYFPAPAATSFPNVHTGKETGFTGLLVVKAEIKSLCSHHHQNVFGTAYIGIIPDDKVIGLSKYTRLAQWCARRGTLQEELAEDIANTIKEYTGSEHISVLIEGRHQCCEARGILAHDSTTITTVLKGDFLTDSTLRKEFHDNVMYQKMNKN